MSFTELPAADREIVWDKRHYLRSIPGALPKVLLAAHSWEYACLPALYGLLTTWSRPQPMDILQACNSIEYTCWGRFENYPSCSAQVLN